MKQVGKYKKNNIKGIFPFVTLSFLVDYYNRRISEVRFKKESYVDKVRTEVILDGAVPTKREIRALAEAAKLRTEEKRLIFYRNSHELLRGIILPLLLVIATSALSILLPFDLKRIRTEYYVMAAQFFMVVLVGLYVIPALKSNSDGLPLSIRLARLSNKVSGIIIITLGLFTSMSAIAIGDSSTPIFVLTTVMLVASLGLVIVGILNRDS